MNLKFKFITFALCAVLCFNKGFAQLTMTNSNSHTQTNYVNDSVLGTDSIYIIYSPDEKRKPILAKMEATHPSGQELQFVWYRYNANNHLFDSIFSETGVTLSTFETDVQGGYKVSVSNTLHTLDTSFVAWLFIEEFQIETVEVAASTCTTMELKTDTIFKRTFTYYDLIDTTPIVFTNSIERIAWSVDPDYTEIAGKLNPVFEAPVEAISLTLTITDFLGFERNYLLNIDEESTDEGNFPVLIAVEADFNGQSANETAPADTVYPEAPHGVAFYNLSKNGEEFQWYFYNHPRWMADSNDTLLTASNSYEPFDSVFYLHPAPINDPVEGYDVALYAWGPEYNTNDDRCLDTLRGINFVIVEQTEFPDSTTSLPNVFSPNEDPSNNTFYYLKGSTQDNIPVTSISYFSIKIYNRWGNKVYDYEDTDGSWTEDGIQGWDGRSRFGGIVKPGVYYYVIMAEGWDGQFFKVPGYVHVFY